MKSPSPFIRRALGLLLLALGVSVFAQMPPTNTVTRRIIGKPNTPVLVTNVVLSWESYTNAFFEIVGATNLASTNWYHVTNAPLWTTNLTLPANRPAEFFKIQTVLLP